MTRKQYILIISICIAIIGCNTKILQTKSNVGQRVDYFTDNGFGNAVAVVQHPAGIYHKGITYVCYQGAFEDPYVASYNHNTGEWKGPFKAGISEMGKDPNRKKKIDNHGKPSIIIDDAGYIHIAFGGHGGMRKHGKNTLGNHHYGKNQHVVSKKPLDISSWKTLNTIPPFGTYNQFVKMDNGDIYLFYRHGAHRSNWVYQKSTDNGRTYEEPVSFLKHKRRTDIGAEDSWYPWISRGDGDDLIVAFDYHLCMDGEKVKDGRGHIPGRYNVYYMVMDTKSGKWRNVKNETLTMPMTKEKADEKVLVANTGSDWTFQGVTDLDPNGNPHVCITVGKDIGERSSAPKHMRHYRWNVTEWIESVNSGLPIGNGDVEVKSVNDVSMYIAEKEIKGAGVVRRWDSSDAGKTFKKGNVLLRREKSSFAISSLIDNAHPDAKLIVAEREPGTDYRKMYLLGNNGPIQRIKEEAQNVKKNTIINETKGVI